MPWPKVLSVLVGVRALGPTTGYSKFMLVFTLDEGGPRGLPSALGYVRCAF